jgi:hypothetical protein
VADDTYRRSSSPMTSSPKDSTYSPTPSSPPQPREDLRVKRLTGRAIKASHRADAASRSVSGIYDPGTLGTPDVGRVDQGLWWDEGWPS